jgi:hypothetical protein
VAVVVPERLQGTTSDRMVATTTPVTSSLAAGLVAGGRVPVSGNMAET